MCGSSLATSVILKKQHVWLHWVTLPRCNSLMSWAATASCTCSSLLILGPRSHVHRVLKDKSLSRWAFQHRFRKKNSCSYNTAENAYPMLIHLHLDCKQEADCILVYATALQRIYLDNLAAKHCKHPNLSLSSITLLWMSTWGFLNKITVYVWTRPNLLCIFGWTANQL